MHFLSLITLAKNSILKFNTIKFISISYKEMYIGRVDLIQSHSANIIELMK